MEADAVRRRLHPERVVTYIIDRNINYTNFCTEYCTFCAFYRPLPKAGVKNPRAEEGYILDFEKIYEKIAETEELGGTGVLMQGGLHPDLKIDWFERLFTGIKQRFPRNGCTAFGERDSGDCGVFGAESAGYDCAAARCRAGLDSWRWAEILDDEVRHRIARLKCQNTRLGRRHRTAHQLGMRTTATMMFGVGETFDQRINHFEVVRKLQKKRADLRRLSLGAFSPTTRRWAGAAGRKLLRSNI